MTTIAWDGKTLAADRRVSFNNISDVEVDKIVKRKKDGALCASSGSASLGAAFKRWFLAGEKGERPPLKVDTEDANGIIIRPSGVFIVHDSYGWYEAKVKMQALGSGWEIALGAMKAGVSAEQAVRIASELDGNTGSSIDTLELPK